MYSARAARASAARTRARLRRSVLLRRRAALTVALLRRRGLSARVRGLAVVCPQEKLRREREINAGMKAQISNIVLQLKTVNAELEEFAQYI